MGIYHELLPQSVDIQLAVVFNKAFCEIVSSFANKTVTVHDVLVDRLFASAAKTLRNRFSISGINHRLHLI